MNVHLFGGVNTNPVLGVSNQAHHKLACRATDEGKNLAILNLKSQGFYNLSRDARKPGSGFPARSCTNWPVHPQKKARSLKFGFQKKSDCTISVAKTKVPISCALTAQLICFFVFAKHWFSHDAAHL